MVWVKNEEGEGEWKPRMLNAKRFKAVKTFMKEVDVVDCMGCFQPFLA